MTNKRRRSILTMREHSRMTERQSLTGAKQAPQANKNVQALRNAQRHVAAFGA